MALAVLPAAGPGQAASGESADAATRQGGVLAVPSADSWVLAGVDLLPMTSDVLLRDRSLVVRDGRIVAYEARGELDPPADLEVIDGAGRIVLPGLADMHVHLRGGEDLERLLDAGVTSARNMWGTPTARTLAMEVASGERHGPRIVSTGPGIDGYPPVRESADVILEPSDAAAVVDRQLADGWSALKVYQRLSPDTYRALAVAAHERNVPLVGHVPTAVPLAAALPIQRSIEHLEGFDKRLAGGEREPGFRSWVRVDEAGMEQLARETADAGAWVCPTLLVASRMLRRNLPAAEARRAIDMRARMVRRLDEAGVPLLAGTDAGVPLVAPGASLHDELDLLVSAGLDRYRVLRMATADAARFLNRESELGTIRSGLRADLLVVSADPREDLAVLRAPEAVIVGGHWVRAQGESRQASCASPASSSPGVRTSLVVNRFRVPPAQ